MAVFIHEFSAVYRKGITGITAEALKRLEQAAWPGNIRQLRSTIQTAIALATTDKLELKDFPDIYPDFVQTLTSIWRTLPPETQHAIWETLHSETRHTIMHELSTRSPGRWCSSQVSYMPRIGGKSGVSQYRGYEPKPNPTGRCSKTYSAIYIATRGSRIVKY